MKQFVYDRIFSSYVLLKIARTSSLVTGHSGFEKFVAFLASLTLGYLIISFRTPSRSWSLIEWIKWRDHLYPLSSESKKEMKRTWWCLWACWCMRWRDWECRSSRVSSHRGTWVCASGDPDKQIFHCRFRKYSIQFIMEQFRNKAKKKWPVYAEMCETQILTIRSVKAFKSW